MSKSLDTILNEFKVEETPKKGETTLSVWVEAELKERHRKLPLRVRQRVASTMREVFEVVIEKAEEAAS